MINSNCYNFYCQYRLPCGYCKELKMDCPKFYTTITCNNIGDISSTITTKDVKLTYDTATNSAEISNENL